MKQKCKKIIYIFLGSLCLFLGTLGIVLPLLPTTPFWLLTAYFYMNASGRLYQKVMSIPLFGYTIRNFQRYKAIPIRVKIISISLLWGVNILSMLVIDRFWIIFLLMAISIAVSIHILSYKSLRNEDRESE